MEWVEICVLSKCIIILCLEVIALDDIKRRFKLLLETMQLRTDWRTEEKRWKNGERKALDKFSSCLGHQWDKPQQFTMQEPQKNQILLRSNQGTMIEQNYICNTIIIRSSWRRSPANIHPSSWIFSFGERWFCRVSVRLSEIIIIRLVQGIIYKNKQTRNKGSFAKKKIFQN